MIRSLLNLDEVVDTYAQHIKDNPHDAELSLFPTAILNDREFCHLPGCWFRASIIIVLTDVSEHFPLCRYHHTYVMKRIIGKWSYEELKRRIIITRDFLLYADPNDGHPDDCHRCGMNTTCPYWIDGSVSSICRNCYEFAFGDMCKFAIMVLHQIPTIIVDVKRRIALLLHLSYIPDYRCIQY